MQGRPFKALHLMTFLLRYLRQTLVLSTFFLVSFAMNDTPINPCKSQCLSFRILQSAVDCQHIGFFQLEHDPWNVPPFAVVSCTTTRNWNRSDCNTYLSIAANHSLRITQRDKDDDERHAVTIHLSAQENSFLYCFGKENQFPTDKYEKQNQLVCSCSIIQLSWKDRLKAYISVSPYF